MPSAGARSKIRTRKRPQVAAAESAAAPRWFWPTLLGILAVGAVLRFLLRAAYLKQNPLAAYPTVDGLTYWNWAGRIASGQLSDGVPYFSAPLYPYLLGLLRALGGGLPAVYTAQVLLDLVTAGLLAWIGRVRFGAAVGLIAAAVFLPMLEPASFSLRVLASTLQLPLVCLAWLALIRAQQRGTLRRGMLAGAALGLLALAYPPAMLCLPLVAVWWWWNHGRDLKAAHAAVCLAAGAAVISPATIHNYVVSGELFPIQSVVGINFRQGNGPGARGTITMIAGTSIDREKLFRTGRAAYRREQGRAGSWTEVDHYYRDQALAYLSADPIRAAQLWVRKAYWFLTGHNYGDIYVPTIEQAEGVLPRLRLFPVHTAWLIPLALLALAVWLRRLNRYLPEWMLFGVPLLVVVVFWFSPRYRLPAIPVIVMGGAWVLRQAWHERRRYGWPIAAGAALCVGFGLGLVNRAAGFDPRNDALRAQFRQTVGIALARNGQVAAAADWFGRALGLNPEYAAAQGNLGSALVELGRPEEGLQHLRLAVQEEPDNPEFRGQLAAALLQQGQYEEALEHLRAAVARDPQSVPLRVTLGNALFEAGQPAAAIEQLDQAERLAPADPLVLHNLGRMRLAQGDCVGALARANEALRLGPDRVETYLLCARANLAAGHVPAAIATLRRAHARWPQDDGITNDLAWHLATLPGLAAADRQEAVALADQVVTRQPQATPEALDTLAAALAATAQFERAVQHMERAIALAERAGDKRNAGAFRRRLALYQAGRPYVAEVPAAGAGSQPNP